MQCWSCSGRLCKTKAARGRHGFEIYIFLRTNVVQSKLFQWQYCSAKGLSRKSVFLDRKEVTRKRLFPNQHEFCVILFYFAEWAKVQAKYGNGGKLLQGLKDRIMLLTGILWKMTKIFVFFCKGKIMLLTAKLNLQVDISA